MKGLEDNKSTWNVEEGKDWIPAIPLIYIYVYRKQAQ